jgi:hypothetical protein
MKYQEGDKIIVLLTNEEGKVVEIMNDKMVMIEVKGVRFPAYMDQIDFPYFKMFSEKRIVEKKKIFIDNIKQEKGKFKIKVDNGVFLALMPVFDKDVFDDDVVEKFKIYLINQTDTPFNFIYRLYFSGENSFELKNNVYPLSDFYLHDVNFEDLSDNPRFDIEFSLTVPDKKKAPYFETSLKLKAKQIFKRIEETKGIEECFFAREIHNDESFIMEHLKEAQARELNMFTYSPKGRKNPDWSVDDVVDEEGWPEIRAALLIPLSFRPGILLLLF